MAETIVRYAGLTREQRLLDYGCGTGLVTLRLIDHVGSVVGLDASPKMVERFRSKLDAALAGKVRVDTADLEKGSIVTGYFDTIVCTQVLSHVADEQMLLRQLLKCLSAKGSLVISEMQSEPPGIGGFSKAQLAGLLSRNGFTIEGCWDCYTETSDGVVQNYYLVKAVEASSMSHSGSKRLPDCKIQA